jgi:putative peptidoglycan lipid II flippase
MTEEALKTPDGTEATRVWRTALVLLPIQVVFRGGEAVLPLLLAAWFGRSAETDLYYLLAAYFVFCGAVLTGAFQDSALVPVLIEVDARSPAELPRVLGALLGHTLAIGAAVATVMGGLASGIAAATSTRLGLALALIALLAFATMGATTRAFYVGVLNARRRFWAHPVASGTGMALTLVVIRAARGALGVCAIPFGLAAGELVAIVLLSLIAARDLGSWLTPTLERPEPVRRILRLVRLEVTGSLITRINPIIDQLMSGLAGVVGGGTLVRYASDVVSLPTSALQATLFPVLMTRLAQDASEPARLLKTARRTVGVVAGVLVATSVALAAVRTPLSALLFGHGSMDAGGVRRIAQILPWGLLGVAPFGALLVLARAHVARQNSRIMPGMGILNSSLNVAFNAVFVGLLGLSGIALSTSLTYFIVAVVFWVKLKGRSSRALDGS